MDELTKARVDLVRRYLAHPAYWPDGIDTKYGRWYTGREAYWAGLVGGNVTDDVTETPPVTETKVGRPKTGEALAAAERMRRMRERKARLLASTALSAGSLARDPIA